MHSGCEGVMTPEKKEKRFEERNQEKGKQKKKTIQLIL